MFQSIEVYLFFLEHFLNFFQINVALIFLFIHANKSIFLQHHQSIDEIGCVEIIMKIPSIGFIFKHLVDNCMQETQGKGNFPLTCEWVVDDRLRSTVEVLHPVSDARGLLYDVFVTSWSYLGGKALKHICNQNKPKLFMELLEGELLDGFRKEG